jgi:hypothetical protein
MIVRSDLRLSLANSKISRARVLDPNGIPVKEILLEKAEHGNSFQFPSDALYVVLE